MLNVIHGKIKLVAQQILQRNLRQIEQENCIIMTGTGVANYRLPVKDSG